MSYNPAFVADESPLANSADDHSQSNGIKLTSFKVLPTSHHQNVILDIGNRNSQQPSKQKGKQNGQQHKTSGGKQASGSRKQQQQQQLQVQQGARNGQQVAGKSGAALATTSKTNGNFCMSTSSSLSLIDNPTLSSFTPSNSSYSSNSTSSPSIVSTNSTASSEGLCAAVECRDMRYDVGRGRNQKTILYSINVTVPEGSIYGLLGPSGCGKTTMLRCVVGRIKPKEGYVRVFGYRPNDSGSQIPGPAIGYMPQVSNLLSRFSQLDNTTKSTTLTLISKPFDHSRRTRKFLCTKISPSMKR